jgi:hypothetical protein
MKISIVIRKNSNRFSLFLLLSSFFCKITHAQLFPVENKKSFFIFIRIALRLKNEKIIERIKLNQMIKYSGVHTPNTHTLT